MQHTVPTTLIALLVLAAAPCASAQSLTYDEYDLASRVNAERTRAGLQPYVIDPRLSAVARAHSRDMATQWYFDHRSPTQGGVGDRLAAARIRYADASENIAYVASTRDAHRSFMSDGANRGNLLSRGFSNVGVGVVRVGRRMLVTETFLRPASRWSAPIWGWQGRRAPVSGEVVSLPSPFGVPTASPAASSSRSLSRRIRAPVVRRVGRRAATRDAGTCSLEGTWRGVVPDGMLRGREVTFVFREGGTVRGTAGSITLDSRWSLRGNTVDLNDVSATPALAACPATQTGRYMLRFADDCRTVEVVSSQDACRRRNLTLDGLRGQRVD